MACLPAPMPVEFDLPSEVVEILDFQDADTVPDVKCVRQENSRRTELIGPVTNFIDGKIDPALWEKAVRKQKSKNHLLHLLRRSYIDVVQIETDVEVIERSDGEKGPCVVSHVLDLVIRISLDKDVEL